jgi:hypothetical protein
MEKFAGGYTRERLRWKLLRWVVLKNRPFAIVEDEELVEILAMLNPKVNSPSGQTVGRDVCDVHEMMMQKLLHLLEVSL